MTQAAPEAAELLEEGGDMGLSSGVAALWEKSISEVKEYLLAGIRSVAMLMCGVVVLGAVESLTPDRRGTVGRGVTLCGALWGHGGVRRGPGDSHGPGAGNGDGDLPVQ